MAKLPGRNFLFLIMASLLLSSYLVSCSNTSEVAEPKSEFDTLLDELRVSDLNLEHAWQKANDSNPYLQFAVDGLAEAKVLDARVTGERNKAVRYVERYEGDVDSARQDFLKLRGSYGAVIGFALYRELYEDEDRSGIVKDFIDRMVERLEGFEETPSGAQSDFDSVDKFWIFAEKRVAEASAEIERVLRDRNFPEFVVQSTRDYAEYSVRFNLYEQYIRLNKPEHLMSAEKEVRAVKIKLSNKWPGWHEKNFQVQKNTESPLEGEIDVNP